MSEIKHYLRKLEFPQVVLEALRQIADQVWACNFDALQNCPKVIYEMVEEFVFQEVDRRGNVRRKLTPIKELQVLNNIDAYFSQHTNEIKSNKLFLILFPPYQLREHRLHMLCRLLSVAVVVQNACVLSCAGIWMQLNGCNTPSSTKIAQTIINDYFKLVPSATSYLRDLPRVSPVFCASLITAVASSFSSSPVPSEVVKIVYDWVATMPLLCVAPVHIPTVPPLKCPQIPLFSLLLWTVLAPLSDPGNSDSDSELLKQVYSGLHLAILDTMVKVKQSGTKVEVLTPRDIGYIADALQASISRCGKSSVLSLATDAALNRLGQALQVALATGCLKGNMSEVFAKLSNFPPNRLLHIVTSKHIPSYSSLSYGTSDLRTFRIAPHPKVVAPASNTTVQKGSAFVYGHFGVTASVWKLS